MREAQVKKIWHAVYSRTYPLVIARISLTNLPPLGTQSFTLSGGITAICGANGVGKTTILQAVNDAILNITWGTADPVHGHRANSASELHANIDETEHVITSPRGSDLSALGPTIDVAFINPADAAIQQRSILSKQTNLEEYLEQLEAKVSTSAELAQLEYILRRKYDEILTFEIPDLAGDDNVLPFFKVKAGKSSYSSVTMGLGELAVHLLLWQLARCRERSILLLEEPETFIAPFSQAALLNVLADVSVRRNIWTIFTTHSPDLLRSVPLSHIRLVTRTGEAAAVETPDRESQLREVLGVEIFTRGLVFVEDSVSAQFLRLLFEHFGFRWVREVEVVVAGSDGQIYGALKALPSVIRRIWFAGVVDGDQRGKSVGGLWPVVFLPGDAAPEVLFRQAAEEAPEKVAEFSQRSLKDVQRILSTNAGIDHHDWLVECSKHFGMEFNQLVMVLFNVWKSVAVNRVSAEKFIGEFNDALLEVSKSP